MAGRIGGSCLPVGLGREETLVEMAGAGDPWSADLFLYYLVLTCDFKKMFDFLHTLNFCTVLNSISCLGRILCNNGPGLQ